MMMIEESIIDKFLFENSKSFIKGDRLSNFLTEDELKQVFEYYNETHRGYVEDLSIPNKCDFISLDKKIISIDKNIYYLDWKSKVYFGFRDGGGEKWNWYGVDTSHRTNQVFLLPKSVSLNNINEFWIPTYEDSGLDLFPTKWSKDFFL